MFWPHCPWLVTNHGRSNFLHEYKQSQKQKRCNMRGFRAHGRNLSKWKPVDAYQDNPKIVYSHAVLGLVTYSDQMYVSLEIIYGELFYKVVYDKLVSRIVYK